MTSIALRNLAVGLPPIEQLTREVAYANMKEPETETETNQDERLKDEVGHGELWERQLLSCWVILQQINNALIGQYFWSIPSLWKYQFIVYSLVIFFLFLLKPKNENQSSFTIPHVVLNPYDCWI